MDEQELREIERERDDRLAEEAGERLGGDYEEEDEPEVAEALRLQKRLTGMVVGSAGALGGCLLALEWMRP